MKNRKVITISVNIIKLFFCYDDVTLRNINRLERKYRISSLIPERSSLKTKKTPYTN